MSTIVGRSATLILSALAASLGAANIGPNAATQSSIAQPLRRYLTPQRWTGGAYRPTYHRGPGWTFAQVKRMARKAKNVRRHRAAVKKARKS